LGAIFLLLILSFLPKWRLKSIGCPTRDA
jgi:hypothetical protein